MRTDSEPVADRPHMPGYGIATAATGLLPWSWAARRLADAHNYWLATGSADGRPHLAAIWGVWLEGAFYFSTGGQSRKARDLRVRPGCAVSTESAVESVVLNGTAVEVVDDTVVAAVADVYNAKYGSGFPPVPENPLFAVHPATVVAIIERDPDFTERATRWTFA